MRRRKTNCAIGIDIDREVLDWGRAHNLGALPAEAAGRITPGCVGLYSDENEEALARVLRFCRDYGNAKMGIQLAHAGRKASTAAPWNGGKPLAEGEELRSGDLIRLGDSVDLIFTRLT